jgi:16S rRNA methyltransferase gidB
MAAFEEILAVCAAEAGLTLTPAQIGQFTVYNDMLVDWNTRMNLTALISPADVAVKHIIDSLTAYAPALFGVAKTLIDVGTGAGLPGIPLAVYAPHIRVTLMDALQKRVRFLTEVTAAMGLTNTRCIHARAEEAARAKEHRAAYDIAVSRAVARMPILLEYTLPFVRTGGTVLALKGRAYAEEAAEGKRAAQILGGGAIHARPVHLPGLDDVRAILSVTKERPTPKAYPRRAGQPEQKPLK